MTAIVSIAILVRYLSGLAEVFTPSEDPKPQASKAQPGVDPPPKRPPADSGLTVPEDLVEAEDE
jgi:hypothetical protein